ncbi:D-aspartate oxidase [Fusarium torreyae]|uniref:D-aspartate oxidase n=1 Tax=Fusarium torreyae TaxID=1237075 RepID=A0A9W8VBB1_9HYPO|nr:D-aspartate oxidase [Fusarium torreyae]
MSARDNIIILGAGIIGLDVALVLAERGYGKSITVIAEHLPGDTATNYTSPWAGCNFSAISGTDANALKWDKAGYFHLSKLASERPEESFVRRTPSTEYWDDNGPRDKIQAMSEYLEDNEYGVRFVRQKLPNIHTAFFSQTTQVVFNCTGNAARSLPGVEDSKCYPTRGQVLLTHAPEVHTNIMRHGKDYETYVIPRPFSKGHVILGGYMQKGNGDGATYSYETGSILDRTKELSAEVRNGDVDVIAAFSGLRPSREGGARVEREDMTVAGQIRTVIHNYGAGGTGFQAGYGMAMDAVRAAEPVLSKIQADLRSKL